MTRKEEDIFESVITRALRVRDIFKITRQKAVLIAAHDQVEAFTAEFGTRVVFIPNDN